MLFTFSSGNDPVQNCAELQAALDQGGSIVIEKPGVYDIAGTLFIGDDTLFRCGPGVQFRRIAVEGKPWPFMVNKAFDKTGEINRNIHIEGLHLDVNGVDLTHYSILPGLRGHLSFLGVENLFIRDYVCKELLLIGFGIHICTFENIFLEKLYIAGKKDGVHLGDGRRFTIRDSTFGTYDDAIALNAYDYGLSTAVYGWLEDGLIENCHDLNEFGDVGFFCRMLSGVWQDWQEGMEIQNSTLAVYNGNLYSVCFPPPPEERDVPWISRTPPTHEYGIREYDDHIPWRFVKKHDGKYDASVRRITIRDVHLHKPRNFVGFTLEGGVWCNSAPKGLPLPPAMSDMVFDGIHVKRPMRYVFLGLSSVSNVRVSNSELSGKIISANLYDGGHPASEYPESDYLFTGVQFVPSASPFYEIAEGRGVQVRFIGCSGHIPEQR